MAAPARRPSTADSGAALLPITRPPETQAGTTRTTVTSGRTARPVPTREGALMHLPVPTHVAPTARRRDQRGITTAEYAVGTAAGAGLAGLLFKLLTGGFGEELLRTLFAHVLSLLGIG